MKSEGVVRRLAIGVLVAAILLMPGMVLAQSDDALRGIVARGVSQTAPRALGIPASSAPVGDGPSTGFMLPTPTPAPLLMPTPTPVPALPGEPSTYSSAGVTFQAPADWDVDVVFSDELYVEFTPFQGDLYAVLIGGGADFPGVLGVVLVRALAEPLVGSFMDDTELLGVEVLSTDQGVPVVAVEFAGDLDGQPGTGVMLVYAPGNDAVLLLAFGPDADWDEFGDALYDVAASVTFDDEMLTIFTASEDTYFADLDETIETIVFPGWHAVANDDPQMPLMVVEPDLTYVVALGKAENFGGELADGGDMLLLLLQAGVDDELGQEIIAGVMESMGGSGGDIKIDASRSAFYATDEGGIIRVVATADLDEETDIPIGVYLDLRPDGSLIMIVIGNLDQALEEEALLLEILAETLVLD